MNEIFRIGECVVVKYMQYQSYTCFQLASVDNTYDSNIIQATAEYCVNLRSNTKQKVYYVKLRKTKTAMREY